MLLNFVYLTFYRQTAATSAATNFTLFSGKRVFNTLTLNILLHSRLYCDYSNVLLQFVCVHVETVDRMRFYPKIDIQTQTVMLTFTPKDDLDSPVNLHVFGMKQRPREKHANSNTKRRNCGVNPKPPSSVVTIFTSSRRRSMLEIISNSLC